MSEYTREPYVALNNLDLVDERGTLNPYAAEKHLFDECVDDLTLDEYYAAATEEELGELTKAVCLEGFSEFRASLPAYKTPEELKAAGQHDPAVLAENALRFIASRIHKFHMYPSPYASLLDRMQNGTLNLFETVSKYDETRGASFLTMVEPHLAQWIKRPERTGLGVTSRRPIVHSEPLRVSDSTYHQVREFHYGQNFKFGRTVEVEELAQLSHFTPEDIEAYGKLHKEYVSFDSILDKDGEPVGLWESDALVDDDLLVNPAEVAARNVVHNGVTKVLNLLDERQRSIIVAKAGLNGGEGMTFRALSTELDIGRVRASQLYEQAIGRLRDIPNIRALAGGADAMPLSSGVNPKDIENYTPTEGPLALGIRRLFRGGEGIAIAFREQGISRRMLYKEIGLHPRYGVLKIRGIAYMSEPEAAGILGALEYLGKVTSGSSLYEIAPLKSGVLDGIYGELETITQQEAA